MNVGKVALDPVAIEIDVATQGAEGAGKLGAAAVGAGSRTRRCAVICAFT